MLKLTKPVTTMIGSMPHLNVRDALNLLEEYSLDIPAWPQLPKLSFKESMIPQYCENFPGIVIDEENRKIWIQKDSELLNKMTDFYEDFVNNDLEKFKISKEYAEGFWAFFEKYKKEKMKIPVAKGQVTGPYTFGLGLNDSENKPVWFDDQYKDIVIKGITMKVLWQLDKLSEIAEKVIIFLDEPILAGLGTPAYVGISDEEVIETLNTIYHSIQERDGIAGTHCCGNMDWGILLNTDVEIISFDSYFYGEKLTLYPEQVNLFLERGGFLAWGIVPTAGHSASESAIFKESKDSLKEKLEEQLEMFIKKGVDEEKLRKQMIITPSCGMGNMDIEGAEKVLRILSEFI